MKLEKYQYNIEYTLCCLITFSSDYIRPLPVFKGKYCQNIELYVNIGQCIQVHYTNNMYTICRNQTYLNIQV